MQFVTNLRPQTIETFTEQAYQPHAWLLSSHRLSNSTLRHALTLREQGHTLFADNGTKKLIEETLGRFGAEAKAIQSELRQVRRQVDRVPRGRDVPADLRRRAADLAERVVADCVERSEAIDWQTLLADQLSMRPTHLIAQEDFATACLIGLSLERETTGWRIEKFTQRNERSLRLWRRVAEHADCGDVHVYAVLSAMDYNTARAAGRVAAVAGATHVALGIASITLDGAATDFYVMGRGSYRLPAPAPRRYVRFAQVARGIADGYQESGRALPAFHALGLGAPTLFPILAGAMSAETFVTIDATSPIHDAVRDHVLYEHQRNADRTTLLKIARAVVQGQDWSFACPFCQAFREKYGHDAAAAQVWWQAQGQPMVTEAHLQWMEPLGQALPLLADLPRAAAADASHTHIAHNHWVITNLAENVPAGAARKAWARQQLEEMAGYESLTVRRGLTAAKEILFAHPS